MFKHTIKYTDFDDNEVEDVFYFNLTKSEVTRMEFSVAGGLASKMERIMDNRDANLVLDEFESIILMSIGLKSDDGKNFKKSAEISENFKQSAAYDELFNKMITDAEFAALFISKVVPKELASGITPEALAKMGVEVQNGATVKEAVAAAAVPTPVSPPPFPAPQA